MSRITTVKDKIPKKASWPGFLASGKDSRTKVFLARKLGKQGLGSTPVTAHTWAVANEHNIYLAADIRDKQSHSSVCPSPQSVYSSLPNSLNCTI